MVECTCPHGFRQAAIDMVGDSAKHHPQCGIRLRAALLAATCVTRLSDADDLDVSKMDAACDRIIATCQNLTDREMASAALAVACNHMIATEASEAHAILAVKAMYQLRKTEGVDRRLLVSEVKGG